MLSVFLLNPMVINGIFGTNTNYPFQILWTLSVELTFYFLLTFIYYMFRKSAHSTAVIILILCGLSAFVAKYFAESSLGNLFSALGFQYLPFFTIGSFLFYIRNLWASSNIASWILISCSISLLFLESNQIESEIDKILVISGLLVVFVSFDHFEIMRSRFLIRLGDISYEIYLVHGILIFPIFQFFFFQNNGSTNNLQKFFLAIMIIIFTLVIAYLIAGATRYLVAVKRTN